MDSKTRKTKPSKRLRYELTDSMFSYRERVDASFDLVLDGIFGFSFEGSIRAPFDEIIQTLKRCTRTTVVSIDIPSGWHVENGNEGGCGLEPAMLVSLTAPKPCAVRFQGVHYVGGRFVPP
jgi:NAD(P)H-hydrate epimerase